jgi:glycosyltransferase involved in cell wall biosynthesis
MKLVVFAHTPPPHHGQSYMVQLMLDELNCEGRDTSPITCFHVNARYSDSLEEIGSVGIKKLLLLFKYVLQAVWFRFRFGVKTLYYVPSPPKMSALYRDWLTMLLCRPFFPKLVLHWHAAGLGEWLEKQRPAWQRRLSFRLLGQSDLSLVLSHYNEDDARKFRPRRIVLVNNGIPDPCPDFNERVLPRRQARQRYRARLLSGEPSSPEPATGRDPKVFRALFLAHCTAEKGLFDLIDGLLIAQEQLEAQKSPLSFHLTIAGTFPSPSERRRFDSIMAGSRAGEIIQYRGFLAGGEKMAALFEADVFCFPTYYANENQPVNLIEAMAFGLPILTTRWRSIPECLPPNYAGVVDLHAPGQIAKALCDLSLAETGPLLRRMFLDRYTQKQFGEEMRAALRPIG